MAFDSSLPKISNVPLGVGGWPLGYEERRCWAIVRVIIVSKISSRCGPDPLTFQTDRQTDRRTDKTTCDRNTALCTKVHRAVKTLMSILSIQVHDIHANLLALQQSLFVLSRDFSSLHRNN